jgi:hypothetical protein
MTAAPCPRCGKAPIEVVEIGQAEPTHLPACPCYPHPPRCVTCATPVDGAGCTSLACPLYAVPQPQPDTDPLWAEVAP